MRFSRSHLIPLPLPLRWVLAVVLIFNGAVSPPAMAHAAMADGHGANAHAAMAHVAPANCHHDDAPPPASKSVEAVKHQHGDNCPCCAGGAGCQCGCIVAFAVPVTFPDLRPLAPLALADELRVPQFAPAPRHRLLRPPIT